MNNTAKELVEQLGDKFEITIMADVVNGLNYEYEQLQKENKELTRLLSNKIMADYDYDSILKNQLGEERLKYVALEESKNMTENILTEIEKWLEEELKIVYRDCGHKHNTLQEVMNKLQELKMRDIDFSSVDFTKYQKEIDEINDEFRLLSTDRKFKRQLKEIKKEEGKK